MKALIKQYVKNYFPNQDNDWFDLVKSRRTLIDQIETAALSLNSQGVMHGHQRRVGLKRLKGYAQAILSQENVDKVRRALKARKFHSVYTVFKEETKHHYMVSGLTAYDVAQRICFAYEVEPEYVYLHTGTTVGAKNLGINVRGKQFLQLNELPDWLTLSLGPADIENFLCIYKNEFRSQPTKRNKISCMPKTTRKIC